MVVFALDKLCAHSAEGLDTERKRGDVQQKDTLDVAAENSALDGLRQLQTHSSGLMPLKPSCPVKDLNNVLNSWNSAGTSDKRTLDSSVA
jgi:hypothetical protein